MNDASKHLDFLSDPRFFMQGCQRLIKVWSVAALALCVVLLCLFVTTLDAGLILLLPHVYFRKNSFVFSVEKKTLWCSWTSALVERLLVPGALSRLYFSVAWVFNWSAEILTASCEHQWVSQWMSLLKNEFMNCWIHHISQTLHPNHFTSSPTIKSKFHHLFQFSQCP